VYALGRWTRGHHDVLVRERDRGATRQLARHQPQGRGRVLVLAGHAGAPQDRRRAADPFEGSEEDALQLVVAVREHHEWELLDLLVELQIGHGEPGSVEELTELIEFCGLERDGISGLDVHRQSIVAEPHP